MNNYNLRVRRGETLPLTWSNDEEGATDAHLYVTQDGDTKLVKSSEFDGLVVDLSLTHDDTDLPTGDYDYMVTIQYEDGTVEKYPDVSGCKDCKLPTLTICEANDEVES